VLYAVCSRLSSTSELGWKQVYHSLKKKSRPPAVPSRVLRCGHASALSACCSPTPIPKRCLANVTPGGMGITASFLHRLVFLVVACFSIASPHHHLGIVSLSSPSASSASPDPLRHHRYRCRSPSDCAAALPVPDDFPARAPWCDGGPLKFRAQRTPYACWADACLPALGDHPVPRNSASPAEVDAPDY